MSKIAICLKMKNKSQLSIEEIIVYRLIKKFKVFFFKFARFYQDCGFSIFSCLLLLSKLAVIFLALYKKFFYSQLSFVLHLQTDFYIVYGNILTFCFFFFRKILVPFTSILTLFERINNLIKVSYIYLKSNFLCQLENKKILISLGKI